MTKFMKKEVLNAMNKVKQNIKQGKGYLSSLTMLNDAGKQIKLSKAEYMGIFEATNVFRLKRGRYPNYTTLNSTANNPLVMNYQDDSVSCGVASFNMAVQMLCGEWIDESTIKKTFKTGSGGTSPSDMINGASKLGYKVEKISRNYSSVKKAVSKAYPVIAHIDTKPATCLGYKNNYGHYILIYAITKEGYYKIADPTKGLKTCSPKNIDNAMLGRTINYYQVKPK